MYTSGKEKRVSHFALESSMSSLNNISILSLSEGSSATMLLLNLRLSLAMVFVIRAALLRSSVVCCFSLHCSAMDGVVM